MQPIHRENNKIQTLMYASEYCENDDGIYIGSGAGKSVRNGYGIMMYKGNQSVYEGEWRNGSRQGKGVLVYETGEYYCGEWLEDIPHGMGVYVSLEPEVQYKGLWANGLKNGQGEQKNQDGSKYVGNYVNDVREGYGKFTYADGAEYEGQFKNNKPEGTGIFRGKQHIYEGSWKNGKMHGSGLSKWYRNGQIVASYLGEYKEGIKQGYGEYTDEKGILYRAMWKHGEVDENAPVDIDRKSTH